MKIQIIGKAQNRIALGIAHAYLKMYPKSTLDDLVRAFPNSLNPDSGARAIFVEKDKINTVCSENWNGFFTNDNTILKLKNGIEVVFVSTWTKKSFDNFVDKAKEYGIEIEKVEKSVGFPDEGFIINDLRQSCKKSSKTIGVYVLILIVLLCLTIYYFSYG